MNEHAARRGALLMHIHTSDLPHPFHAHTCVLGILHPDVMPVN